VISKRVAIVCQNQLSFLFTTGYSMVFSTHKSNQLLLLQHPNVQVISPASSSLKITNSCIQYASPCLWSKLPNAFCQPSRDHSSLDSVYSAHARSSSLSPSSSSLVASPVTHSR